MLITPRCFQSGAAALLAILHCRRTKISHNQWAERFPKPANIPATQEMSILEILQNKACTIFFSVLQMETFTLLSFGYWVEVLLFTFQCLLISLHWPLQYKMNTWQFFLKKCCQQLSSTLHHLAWKGKEFASPKLTFFHINCPILRKYEVNCIPELKPVTRPTKTLLQVLLSWSFARQNLSTCLQQFIKTTTTTSFHIDWINLYRK